MKEKTKTEKLETARKRRLGCKGACRLKQLKQRTTNEAITQRSADLCFCGDVRPQRIGGFQEVENFQTHGWSRFHDIIYKHPCKKICIMKMVLDAGEAVGV